MKSKLLIYFCATLVTLIILGSGFFLPALIALVIIIAQRLATKFELDPGPFPSWFQVLANCYAANFLALLINWIL